VWGELGYDLVKNTLMKHIFIDSMHVGESEGLPKKPRSGRNVEETAQKRFVWWARHHGLALMHPPNELLSKCSRGQAARMVEMGVQAGMPDLIIFTKVESLPEVRFVAVEMKSPTGSLSAPQKRIRRVLEREGGRYHVARSFEEAKTIALVLWPEAIIG